MWGAVWSIPWLKLDLGGSASAEPPIALRTAEYHQAILYDTNTHDNSRAAPRVDVELSGTDLEMLHTTVINKLGEQMSETRSVDGRAMFRPPPANRLRCAYSADWKADRSRPLLS